jgi:hypothetical protein
LFRLNRSYVPLSRDVGGNFRLLEFDGFPLLQNDGLGTATESRDFATLATKCYNQQQNKDLQPTPQKDHELSHEIVSDLLVEVAFLPARGW